MKIEIPKDWFLSRAQQEEGHEIGAGSTKVFAKPELATQQHAGNLVSIEQRLSFSHFIALMRRKRGWSIQQLAKQADLDAGELIVIEKDPHTEPELSTVYNLANALALPVQKLIKMAGLAEECSPKLASAGVRFLASSESTAPLNEEEEIALQTFLKVVLEESDKK
jgi:transcriptional regulator with XRE-family HTH domain